MANTKNLITLDDVQNSVQAIDRKIILVDSSKYTDEAFEYLLDIIDESKIIAFIVNERKIYTHGEYFGGDLWEDTLNYFSRYAILDNDNKIVTQFYANSPKELLQWKGEGGIYIYSDYDIERDANVMHIQYDLETAIDDTSVVEIGDKYIKLTKHDDKLALDFFETIDIQLIEPNLIEYDNGNTQATISMNITNGSNLQKFEISADENAIPVFNSESGNITVFVMDNTNTTVTVTYGDKYLTKTTSIMQKWGYSFAFGSIAIVDENYDSFKSNDIEDEFHEKTISIDIPENYYGWFAYPASIPIKFEDADSGLVGGWQKHHKIHRYVNEIEYQVYRTEQTGLGLTKWKITKK